MVVDYVPDEVDAAMQEIFDLEDQAERVVFNAHSMIRRLMRICGNRKWIREQLRQWRKTVVLLKKRCFTSAIQQARSVCIYLKKYLEKPSLLKTIPV